MSVTFGLVSLQMQLSAFPVVFSDKPALVFPDELLPAVASVA